MQFLEIVRGMQRPLIGLGLVSVVCYAAFHSEAWAQEIVKAGTVFLLGHLFGERAALKNPNGGNNHGQR